LRGEQPLPLIRAPITPQRLSQRANAFRKVTTLTPAVTGKAADGVRQPRRRREIDLREYIKNPSSRRFHSHRDSRQWSSRGTPSRCRKAQAAEERILTMTHTCCHQRATRSVHAAALAAGFVFSMAVAVAPPAAARVDLAVGMPINIGNHGCSLGFFGSNARGDRLAVTAGHCSDSVPDEPVYADNGVQIGQVVAWKQDAENSSGKLNGARGYTVIVVYKRFSVEPFFTGVSSSTSGGAHVTKFGQRTGKTNGVVNTIHYDPKQPDLALMSSNMVQLPGDSGCPWYTNGDALVGMGSSGDQEWAGGDAGSQAQPIQAVLDLIRSNGSVWTAGFTVWTQ
jgi:hypothetical protein